MPNPDHPYFLLRETCRSYHATLVAVSKTRPVSQIEELYRFGQRIFGENRPQELLVKAPQMAPDIEWHLIGHLQTNKVRSILPYTTCIQSLDRKSLWEKIQQEAVKQDLHIRCLLQIKIATEESKYGWAIEELEEMLKAERHRTYPNVLITGVMGMASLTADMVQVRNEMRMLKAHFENLKRNFFPDQPAFNTISMGMSGDYQIALEEGATMIRVGSLLFAD